MMPIDDEQNVQPESYLKNIYSAASERNLERMEQLLRRQQDPTSIEETFTTNAWEKLASEEKQLRWQKHQDILRTEQEEREKLSPQPPPNVKVGWLQILVLVLLLGFGIFAGFLLGKKLSETSIPAPALGEFTPMPTINTTEISGTPIPATRTPTLTQISATPSPEPTPQPPEPTPFTSRYFLSPGVAIYPPLPVQADAVWVLNDQDASVNPPLTDSDIWTQQFSADKAASNESFYSTVIGQANIVWEMDIPMNDGVYMLYVLDTLSGSGDLQAYSVKLDNEPVKPYRGLDKVIFDTTQFGMQSADTWLPIGAYQIMQGQKLTVQATVEQRDESRPFALDRLLITRLTSEATKMLTDLPSTRNLGSLLDDQRATFSTATGDTIRLVAEQNQPVSLPGDVLAWNGTFKHWGSAWATDIIVEWASAGRLPAGKYELYVWVPGQHATASGEFQLLADNEVVHRDNPAPLIQRDFPDQWVSMGTWQILQESAVMVRYRVSKDSNLLADGITQAEIGADAVALVFVESN